VDRLLGNDLDAVVGFERGNTVFEEESRNSAADGSAVVDQHAGNQKGWGPLFGGGA
jgi:hypothetical protein